MMINTAVTSSDNKPSLISIINIITTINPCDMMKVTSSDNTPIQFSSIKTMSVERTALIFPMLPSVKYPMGSFLK